MKTSLISGIGGAALVLALAGWFVLRPDAARTDDDAGIAAPSADAVAAQPPASEDLRQMQAQVAALQAQVAGLKGRDRGANATISPEEGRRRNQEDERRHAAYVAKIQSEFALEPVDARWSSNATSRLWNSLNQSQDMRGAARDVQCRSTMCRVEMSDDGSGAIDKHLPLWAQQFADTMPRMVGQTTRNPRGGAERVLYLMSPEPTAPPVPKG